MQVSLRNAIAQRVINWSAQQKLRNAGRKPKLSLPYILDRIFFICRTGCQWRHLPVQNGSYQAIWHHFNRWSKARLFEHEIYFSVTHVPCRNILVDTSFVKNVCGQDVVGRNPTDRGRKATKISMLTNEAGMPLTACFHQANKSDQTTLHHLLNECVRKTDIIGQAFDIFADKGYDSECNRSVCRAFGLEPCIAKRGIRSSASRRYAIEQTFGIIDLYRRLKVRYEKKIAHFKSFHFIVFSQIIHKRLGL